MRVLLLSLLLLPVLDAFTQDINIPNGSTVTSQQTLNDGFDLTLGGTINSPGVGVSANGDNTITIEATGQINNGSDGIQLRLDGSEFANIFHSGSINTSGDDGMDIQVSYNATLTINSFGSINNTGGEGIQLDLFNDSSTVINNSGTINTAGDDGIDLDIFNNATLSLSNSGTLTSSVSDNMELRQNDFSILTLSKHRSENRVGSNHEAKK